MDIPHILITQLTELSDALEENGTDLTAILAVLVDDLTTAVPSFLGPDNNLAPADSDGPPRRTR